MIDVTRRKFAVTGGDIQRVHEALKGVPGVSFSRQKDALTLPLEMRILEIAVSQGKAQPSEETKTWYQQRFFEEIKFCRVLDLNDTTIVHPQAEKLYPFQRVGAQFISTRKRSLLCDDCGLGKTAQAIIGAELTQCSNVLVLCPNTLKSTWQDELDKWSATDPQITIFESPKRKRQLKEFSSGCAIVNYEQFRVEPGFGKFHWDWVICDEAHTIKNRRTKLYKALKQLTFDNAVLLTGTPFGNDPSELWALLHFLYPKEYPSFWRFFELYVEYIETPYGRQILGSRNERFLRRDLAPKMGRRKKEDVDIQLPRKTYQTITTKMLPTQKKIYTQMAKEMLIEIEGQEDVVALNAISRILRLQQILSTPAAFSLPDVSSKLDTVLTIIQGTERKVVVFTLFRATVKALCERLAEQKIPHAKILGGLSTEELSAAREALNTGSARVLVCTLKAGGVGLTLIGASTAIFVEKHWNPMIQAQAEDRIHRIGQRENVHIISLLCRGTVDMLVEKIIKRKLTMTRAVLGEALLEELRDYLEQL